MAPARPTRTGLRELMSERMGFSSFRQGLRLVLGELFAAMSLRLAAHGLGAHHPRD